LTAGKKRSRREGRSRTWAMRQKESISPKKRGSHRKKDQTRNIRFNTPTETPTEKGQLSTYRPAKLHGRNYSEKKAHEQGKNGGRKAPSPTPYTPTSTVQTRENTKTSTIPASIKGKKKRNMRLWPVYSLTKNTTPTNKVKHLLLKSPKIN